MREWIINVGCRTAIQRTAHLLCEVVQRLYSTGLAVAPACTLLLTRIELSDALGLTPVHVSRTLQWLGNRKLIEFGDGALTIHNGYGLKQVAGFDPAYLH